MEIDKIYQGDCYKKKKTFEDIQVLVNWALDRLPLAAPPKENEVQSPEEESTSEPK